MRYSVLPKHPSSSWHLLHVSIITTGTAQANRGMQTASVIHTMYSLCFIRYQLALRALERYPGEVWDNAPAMFEHALTFQGRVAAALRRRVQEQEAGGEKLILSGYVADRSEEGLWLFICYSPKIIGWLPLESMSKVMQGQSHSPYQHCSLAQVIRACILKHCAVVTARSSAYNHQHRLCLHPIQDGHSL